MRITCPTCDAHYEIGDDLIRPEGREVQCSNCGTMWFEKGRARSPAMEDNPDEDDTEEDDADEDGETGNTPAPPAPPRRPAAGKAALDILREERAREDRLRAKAGSGVRATATPGAGAPPARSPREAAAAERVRMAAAATRARARTGNRADLPGDVFLARKRPETGAEAGGGPGADARKDAEKDVARAPSGAGPAGEGIPPAAVPAAPAVAAARRGRITRLALLPDIEEINSSLHSEDRGGTETARDVAPGAAADPAARTGFRAGFTALCALALALVAVYAFDGPIGRGIPALAAPVARYVFWVDQRRAELEGAVEALTERITPEP